MEDPAAAGLERLIEANFQRGIKTLLGALRVGELDRELVHEFARVVAASNNCGWEQGERQRIATKLWQLAFYIQEELTFHFDPMDVARITNASDGEVRALPKLIFYICARFTHAQTVDEKDLLLETYI